MVRAEVGEGQAGARVLRAFSITKRSLDFILSLMGSQECFKRRVTLCDFWFQQTLLWLFGEELMEGRPKRKGGMS